MSNDADEIVPRLWLGNFNSSQNIDFIKNHRITVIVNCTKDLPFLSIPGVYKYRVPVHDNLEKKEIYAMSKWINKLLPILAEHYRNGRVILVHCAMGMQRSAIVVLCFLYKYFEYDPKTTLVKIRSRRPIAFTPYMNFSACFLILFGENAYRKLIS
jgi:protein-tyrosine phosphatase